MAGARVTLTSALALLLCALAASAARAATITVSNTNDSGPGSLRQAIVESAPGETLLVPAGTYRLGKELQISHSLTIDGAGASGTILSAGGQSRVLLITGQTTTVKIVGLTVREGVAPAVSEVADGGGIEDEEASLTLERDTIMDNRADADGAPGKPGQQAFGGGVDAGTGQLTMIEDVVSNNTAEANGGVEMAGGLAIAGGVEAGDAAITKTSFLEDAALARGGDGPVNSAQVGGVADGGGMRLVDSGGTDVLSEATFTRDTADASDGPGGSAKANPYSGPLAQGGGLFLRNRAEQLAVSSITAAEDTAIAASDGEGGLAGEAQGGGVLLQNEGETLTLANATVNADAARAPGAEGTAVGGGVYAYGKFGPATILSSTIDGDSVEGAGAQTGGGDLGAAGSVPVRDTIVSSGSGPAGAKNCEGKLESLANNLESLNECGLHQAGDISGADPLLGSLQANGGFVPTQALPAGSPALNAGSASGCPALDARGVTRPQASACDIGAYESAPPQLGSALANAIGPTGATLTVPVTNADVLPATLVFEYGTTAAYGSSVATPGLAAAMTSSLSVNLSGLVPGTLYYFRAVAANPDGIDTGQAETFITSSLYVPLGPPPGAPSLSDLRLTPSKLRAAKGRGSSVGASKRGSGASISYYDSESATATFTVQAAVRGYLVGRSCQARLPRHHRGRLRGCTRYVTRGSFTHNDSGAGSVKLHFTGRVNGRPLAPGRYRLRVLARNARGHSRTLTVAFRVSG